MFQKTEPTSADQLEAGGVQMGVQQTLLQVLEQRFGPLSGKVVQNVIAIASIEELQRLVSQVMTARSLHDMGFGPLKAKLRESKLTP